MVGPWVGQAADAVVAVTQQLDPQAVVLGGQAVKAAGWTTQGALAG